MKEIKAEKQGGILALVPERRGRVLFVNDGETPILLKKNEAGPGWMCNFYKLERNLTATFWLKSVVEKAPTATDNLIFDVPTCWAFLYNHKEKKMKVNKVKSFLHLVRLSNNVNYYIQ